MKKAGIYALWFANLCGLVLAWAWIAVHHPFGNLLTADKATLLISLGRLAGLLAVYGILVQLLLIGRTPWIEKIFGMDRLTRVHATHGILILFTLAAHPILLTAGFAEQNMASWAEQFVSFLKDWEDVSRAAAGLLIFVILITVSMPFVKKHLKYEGWYRSHLVIYLAILLALGHQFEVGWDLKRHPLLRNYVYGLYIFAFGNLLIFRLLKPLYCFIRCRFRVERLVKETEDVTSVYIRGKNHSTFRVQAGQFMIFRFLGKGFWTEAHPFSLSCAPHPSSLIRISVKRLGDFTAKIPSVKPGTPVLIDGPHGIFTSALARRGKILLIAGGIGITPLCSLASEFVRTGKYVTLLYGNRREKDIALRADLEVLTQHSNFRIYHILSQEPDWAGERGNIDRARIERLVPELLDHDVFLCGPPVMLRLVLKTLRELKVPAGQIHYEQFSF